MTTRIYDPNNVPFDVTEGRAADLVLNKGWTRQPTTTVPVAAPAADQQEPVVDDWRIDAAAEQETEDGDEPAEALAEEAPAPSPARSRRAKK